MSCVFHAFASVHCCFVVTCWERADLLALVCDVYCVFVIFPCGTLGQVWYLILSFPDLYHLSYFISLNYAIVYLQKDCYAYQNLSYVCCSKTKKTDLSLETSAEINFEFIKFVKHFKLSPFDENTKGISNVLYSPIYHDFRFISFAKLGRHISTLFLPFLDQ